MGVQLRVLGPRGAVLEDGHHQTRPLPFPAAVPPPGEGGGLFQVVQGRLQRVSVGGLITALSVEQHPDIYDGGLAMCGPYGDFQGQVNHFGDFRVVFDYFFPGLMPGPALTIPHGFMAEWDSGYFVDVIEPVVFNVANSSEVDQLLSVTGVSPFGYDLPESTESIERLLWYNVYAPTSK